MKDARRALFVQFPLLMMILQKARGLSCLARYAVVVRPPRSDAGARLAFDLAVSLGSVVDFSYTGGSDSSAIVNAANEACLGGGGVDGAISSAGGPNLLADRMALPEKKAGGIRCPTGDAVITGPGSYGTLGVPYVIHAVGPKYMAFDNNLADGDKLLYSAYSQSLERAREANLEAVAFSLISSGIFRGRRSKREVLRIGVEAIADFGGYDGLKEVHMCAYSAEDGDALCDIASELGLPEVRESQ